MKMDKSFIFKLCFNIIETIIIFMVGLIFKINPSIIITLMIIFFITRLLCGKPKHYNKWYRCFIWSLLTFTSVYALSDLHIVAILFLTVFAGFIATGRADINDIYQWKGNTLNQEVFDWVKFNQENNKLLEYENRLKQVDKQKYFIFIYRFRELKSFNEISKLMEIPIQRIGEEINVMSHFIEYSIRLDI